MTKKQEKVQISGGIPKYLNNNVNLDPNHLAEIGPYSQQDSQTVSKPQILPKVAILLCTYQGQNHLAEQLDSFATQDFTNWKVWVSDNGSRDETYAILKLYQSKWGEDKISIQSYPKENFVSNFLSLLCNNSIQFDYYAYSDQDDIWEKDKLQRALYWLQTIPKDTPALYCSRTRLVNENNKDIGFSPLYVSPPSFSNALVQNIGGGNTMVFNAAARNLLCKVGESIDVAAHDWWTYIAVSGCGGKVFYDPYPSIRYRQHKNNLMGSKSSWFERLKRTKVVLNGCFKDRNDRNIQALQNLLPTLTPENLKTLELFSTARNRWLVPRLIGIKRSGVYRQSIFGNLCLMLTTLFKKI